LFIVSFFWLTRLVWAAALLCAVLQALQNFEARVGKILKGHDPHIPWHLKLVLQAKAETFKNRPSSALMREKNGNSGTRDD